MKLFKLVDEILIKIADACNSHCIDSSEGQPHCFDPRGSQGTNYGGEHSQEIKDQLHQLILDELPKERKASKANPANGSSNHSFRLGHNHALSEVRQSLDKLFKLGGKNNG